MKNEKKFKIVNNQFLSGLAEEIESLLNQGYTLYGDIQMFFTESKTDTNGHKHDIYRKFVQRMIKE